ncbi:MAG: SMI1/KNR4 family protein [Chitinophagaceae bacterium]|nr:SMI1/KNR4 family protein [Chitinophagaceae bacterium]
MAAFNLFRKKDNIDWVTLPQPDDTVSFFETVKKESEIFWADTSPNKGIYGFQIQQDSKWRQGLNDTELQEFENSIGFSFPTPLRNFYKTMNGLTKQGINLYGNNGTQPAFRSVFYSYPDDLKLIQEQIEWIYEATSVKKEDLESLNVSRIFPVYGHRFMLVDIPGNPILSMYGDDIIFYAENLSKLLANEIFSGVIYNVSDFESPPNSQPEIKFWLD